MNDWQVVPKRRTINGIKFRLRSANGKLMIYIGSSLRKKLKNCNLNGYCNIYKKDVHLMIQLTCSPDGNSRRLWRGASCLPYELVRQHWQDGAREREIPAKVEKGNLILLDLRDLGK